MSNDLLQQAQALKLELDEYGYVVVRELISREIAESVAGRLKELLRAKEDCSTPEVRLRALWNALDPGDDRMFLELVAHPLCLNLARLYFGDAYQMAEVGVRWRKPGAPSLPLHVGAPLECFDRAGMPVPDCLSVLSFSWILGDMTAENGERRFMPFSQRMRRQPRADFNYHSLTPVHAPSGSIVFFNSLCWHEIATNPPVGPERLELASAYFAPWLDPTAQGWRLMQRNVRQRMPEHVRKLNRHVAEES